MKLQYFIQERFSGALNNDAEYFSLVIQVFAVLVLGLITWRLMVVFHKRKNAKRKTSNYFDSSFAKQWQNKEKK